MKYIALLLLACTMTITLLQGQNPMPYTDGNNWGYCDANRKIVISLQYAFCRPFNEHGLAVVEKKNKESFVIDNKGNELIGLGRIFDVEQLTADVAVVQKSNCNGCYQVYLVPERKEVPNIFPYFRLYSEGYAATSIDGKSGYVNLKGEPWLMGKFDLVTHFSEGLASVKKGSKWGYIDVNGKVVIPFKFEETFPFSEGRARIQSNGKTGYIDKTGNIVIPCKYDYIHEVPSTFINGTAIVSLDKKYGLTDPNGTLLIPVEYDGLYYAGEGLYEARKGENKMLLEKNGKLFMQLPFKYFFRFREGWAQVETEQYDNFIAKNGNLLLPRCKKFEVLKDFDHGYALCRMDKGGKFYIDKEGQVLSSQIMVPFQGMPREAFQKLEGYDLADQYNGCVIVQKDGLYSILDLNGNKMIPNNFTMYEVVTKEKILHLKDERGNHRFFQGKLEPVSPALEKELKQAVQWEDLKMWYARFKDTLVSERKTKTITVGDQVWMAEDLRTKTFRNGDTIYLAKWPNEFIQATVKKQPALYIAYPDFLKQSEEKATYFYNRYALNDKRGLLPDGMKIPDTTDWKKLIHTAYGDSAAMGLLMQTGFSNLGYFLVVDGEGGFNPGTRISCWWNQESGKGYSCTTMFIPLNEGIIKFNYVADEYGVPIRGIKGNATVKKVPPK